MDTVDNCTCIVRVLAVWFVLYTIPTAVVCVCRNAIVCFSTIPHAQCPSTYCIYMYMCSKECVHVCECVYIHQQFSYTFSFARSLSQYGMHPMYSVVYIYTMYMCTVCVLGYVGSGVIFTLSILFRFS